MFDLKLPMIREGNYPAQFPLKHMRKDLKFVVDTAYDMKGAVPSGHTVLQLFNRAMGRGLGDQDLAAVHEVLRALNEG
jgi:3-hydroxyisobutyrate dehydrogenase-like beta-hydroxyacid dehydrogenase